MNSFKKLDDLLKTPIEILIENGRDLQTRFKGDIISILDSNLDVEKVLENETLKDKIYWSGKNLSQLSDGDEILPVLGFLEGFGKRIVEYSTNIQIENNDFQKDGWKDLFLNEVNTKIFNDKNIIDYIVYSIYKFYNKFPETKVKDTSRFIEIANAACIFGILEKYKIPSTYLDKTKEEIQNELKQKAKNGAIIIDPKDKPAEIAEKIIRGLNERDDYLNQNLND